MGQPKIANLDKITQDHPLVGEAFQSLVQIIQNLSEKLSIDPQGNTLAPPAPQSINVTANSTGIHRVSIVDNNPRTRNLEYFHEYSLHPDFREGSVQTEHLGVQRQNSVNIAMGQQPIYHRVYSQYRDGPKSDFVYFGSSTNPTGVVDGAAVTGPDLHPSTGSGTASTGGQGFGTEKYVSSEAAPGRPPKVFKE